MESMNEGVETPEPTQAAQTEAQTAQTEGADSLGSNETSIGDSAQNRERAPKASDSAESPAKSEAEPSQEEKKPAEKVDLLGDDEDGEEQGEKPADETGTLGAPEDGYKFEHVEDGAKIDDQTLAEFGDVAKELNLSQEAAQKIVSKLEPMLQRSLERNVATWAEQTRADEEIGGANLKSNLSIAKRAFKQTTTPELRALLQVSGLTNHPEVVRHFLHLGKRLSDGAFVTSGARKSEGSAQTVFYKGMNP